MTEVLSQHCTIPERLTMPPLKILVCGAGIAGSTVAYWLSRNGFNVVVIERSPAKQGAGQGIDIEGPGLEIVKMMGIFDELQRRTTKEAGSKVVDEHNRTCGTFDAGGVSATKEIEIMRGDLADILYDAANAFSNVTFQFETTVRGLRQTAKKVSVDLEQSGSKTTTTEDFDIVVAADGTRSRTRQYAMGTPEELNCLKPVGCFTSFFSIPQLDGDWPYSRLCQFPDRRTIFLRPQGENSKFASVYLSHFHDDDPALCAAFEAGDQQLQKEALAKLFEGLGWETPRIIDEMLKTDNFYMDKLAQVKLPKWSKDRVVLLGDAGYAPTPLTGQGTLIAIMGAYVLAQELSRCPDDATTAFEKYEKRLRPYVKNSQSIPLNGYAPYILNPQTWWGIWLFRTIAGLISWSGLVKYLPSLEAAGFDLEAKDKSV